MDTSSTSPYHSLPLDPKRGEIRLMELMPGVADDLLRIQLRVVRRNETHDYEALSYVWGQETSATPAIVNGVEVVISSNLDGALRRFRNRDQPRTMWVDAVCINQQDHNEKSHQVQIMGSIYSSAFQVLVWLGEAAADSDFVFDTLNSCHLDERDAPRLIWALWKVYLRPWFERIWVIQEVVLATREPRIQCGSRSASWQAFFGIAGMISAKPVLDEKLPAALQGLAKIILGYVYDDCTETSRENWKAFLATLPMSDLENLNAHTKDFYSGYQDQSGKAMKVASTSIDWTSVRSSGWTQTTIDDFFLWYLFVFEVRSSYVARPEYVKRLDINTLLTLLAFTAEKKATDPRDKIYGLLGIPKAELAVSPIVPDYSAPVARVFSEAMACLLSGSLGVYAALPLWPRSAGVVPDLPSWVRDFSQEPRLQWDEWNPYNILPLGLRPLSPPFPPSFSSDFRILSTVGRVLGTVKSIAMMNFDNTLCSESSAANIRKMTSGSDVTLSTMLDTLTGSSAKMKLALETSRDSDQTGSISRTLEYLFCANSPSIIASETAIGQATNSFFSSANNRGFFVTDTNRVGLTMLNAQPGDIVAGLFGVDLPFILRPVDGHHVMVNVAHIGDHRLVNDFPEGITSEDLCEKHGYQVFNIH